jgi:ankyrin repeat protein
MRHKSSRRQTFAERLQGNRVVAVLLLAGSVVVGLATFTDAARRLASVLVPQRPEDARMELTRLSLAYTPAAFVRAAAKGDVVAVKLFLAAGMPVDEVPERAQTTALFEAAREGRAEMVDVLLKAGANPNPRQPEHPSALAAAAASGHRNIVDVLLTKNPAAAAISHALVAAAGTGRHEIARLLWQHGTPAGPARSKALIHAASSMRGSEQDHVATINFLLDVGTPVNITDGDKDWTPLHFAAYHGHPVVAEALLKRGADPNARDADGATALWWTAGVGRHEATVVLLGSHAGVQADVNARDNEGRTPLWRAAYNKDARTVELLLAHGADVNAGESALLTVPDTAIAQVLLNRGADVNARSKDSLTVLMMHAYRGSVVGLQALLDRGAQVDAVNASGYTALMLAAAQGHVDTVRTLLKRGARTDGRNAEGQTALQMAQASPPRATRDQLVQLLRAPRGR